MRLIRTICIVVLALASFANALDRQPNADYRARREALAAKTSGGTVILFAPTEAEGPNQLQVFRQEDFFYYLTGLEDPGAAVLISPAVAATESSPAKPYTEILFLPGQNVSQEKWTGPKLNPKTPSATELTGFEKVMPLDAMRDELVRILPSPRASIYTDTKVGSPSDNAVDWLRRANSFPNYAGFSDVKPLLSALRITKDAGETALIRKATEASVEAHKAVMRAMRPNMTEREISALFQYEFMKRGCERPAYAPIVASGYNGTVLHYGQNSGVIRDGDLVVMDVGGEYSMYASDITRTLPANGKFTARQKEIYEIVLGAQQAAMDAFKAGESSLRGKNSLHQVAMDHINRFKDKNGDPMGKYFIHGLSHYVGLGVHDPGSTSAPLQPGAVFTIEPGIYLPDEKLGVRIEDMYWVNEKGELINLSGALPRSVADVEKAMAEGRAPAKPPGKRR